MAQTIQLRRDSKTNWELYNPVLAAGELGLQIDTWQFKVGDGVTAWNDLPFSSKTYKDQPEEFIQFLSITSITYGANGLPDTIIFENGAKCINTYDANDLLIHQDYTDTDGTTVIYTVDFAYNTNGNLTSVTRSFV